MRPPILVMAGLDPATHVLVAEEGVGTRVKPAHDGFWVVAAPNPILSPRVYPGV